MFPTTSTVLVFLRSQHLLYLFDPALLIVPRAKAPRGSKFVYGDATDGMEPRVCWLLCTRWKVARRDSLFCDDDLGSFIGKPTVVGGTSSLTAARGWEIEYADFWRYPVERSFCPATAS